ncbi:GSCOCG00007008001-RA-CDS [Cotesia congregata]|uniref:RING-type domain-containing protein n=1 Tax=Cotesia congregata TaxID=51543 RepID=A0A8J2H9K9_COTCN|nr:GSCOCG00007008001-RA-CDS [Cotesia congregata]CAG5082361.1 Protein of unknown function [Cotesia congregata]
MDFFIQGIQQALETRRYSILEFLKMAAIRRVEVRYRLDVAVMRQRYFNDDLIMEEEVLLEHIRDVAQLLAIQAPMGDENPIDGVNYYVGETIMQEEQEIAPWIHAATAGMIFQDQPAAENNTQCCVCLMNEAKAVFCPCGHLCLCMECKHKTGISPKSTPRPDQNRLKFVCFICQTPSHSLMAIF